MKATLKAEAVAKAYVNEPFIANDLPEDADELKARRKAKKVIRTLQTEMPEKCELAGVSVSQGADGVAALAVVCIVPVRRAMYYHALLDDITQDLFGDAYDPEEGEAVTLFTYSRYANGELKINRGAE